MSKVITRHHGTSNRSLSPPLHNKDYNISYTPKKKKTLYFSPPPPTSPNPPPPSALRFSKISWICDAAALAALKPSSGDSGSKSRPLMGSLCRAFLGAVAGAGKAWGVKHRSFLGKNRGQEGRRVGYRWILEVSRLVGH